MTTDTGSRSSVGAGVGVGVGVAVVLLVVMMGVVLGVGLFCVWRRRHTFKMIPLATLDNEDMDLVDNSY